MDRFEIHFTESALGDLKALRKYDQRRILDAVEAQLSVEPTRVTRHRKRLRPNPLSEWELRVGSFRVFYTVSAEENVVLVLAVGYKRGNRLWIRDQEVRL